MSSSQDGQRSNYKAGMVILLLAALASLGMAYLNWLRNHPSDIVSYEVVFDLENGVEGLEPGSVALYGGIQIGTVRQVRYDREKLIVSTDISGPYGLHPGASLYRSGSLIGGAASMVVRSIGRREEPRLPAGSLIEASVDAGGANRIMGGRNINRIQKINERIREALARIDGMTPQMEQLRTTGNDFTRLTEDLSRDTDAWNPVLTRLEGRIQSIKDRTGDIGRKVDQITETSTVVMDRYQAISERFDTSEETELIRPIEDLLADYRTLAADFETHVLQRAEALVERAEGTRGASVANVELLESNGKLIKSTLDRFIADSTLASQELARTESEVIGALGLPLLERPTSADRAQLIRAEAMSDWARVAEQIHLLLQAIETISLDDDVDDQAGGRTLATLTETLKATLRDYEEVQSRLFRPTTVRAPQSEE